MIQIILSLLAKLGIGPLLSKLWTSLVLPQIQNIDVSGIAEKLGANKAQTISISVLLVAVIFFAVRSNGLANANAELALANQNVAAMADSVSYERNRADELEAVRLSLVTEADELHKYSAGLADELKKERGEVESLSRSLASISRDTVYLENIVLVDSSSADVPKFSLSWQDTDTYGNSSRFLEGTTFVEMIDDMIESSTAITRDEINLYIVQGIRINDNNQYETFIRTDYPGVKFNTESAVLNVPEQPRTKKWGIGVGAGWDFINQGPSVHVGLQRNLLRF